MTSKPNIEALLKRISDRPHRILSSIGTPTRFHWVALCCAAMFTPFRGTPLIYQAPYLAAYPIVLAIVLFRQRFWVANLGRFKVLGRNGLHILYNPDMTAYREGAFPWRRPALFDADGNRLTTLPYLLPESFISDLGNAAEDGEQPTQPNRYAIPEHQKKPSGKDVSLRINGENILFVEEGEIVGSLAAKNVVAAHFRAPVPLDATANQYIQLREDDGTTIPQWAATLDLVRAIVDNPGFHKGC